MPTVAMMAKRRGLRGDYCRVDSVKLILRRPRRADAGRVLDVRILDARFEVIDGAIRVLAVVQAHLCACCEVPRSVLLRQTCKIGVSSRANAPRAFSLARGRQE